MRPLRLLFDTDEVFADFQTPTFDIIEQLTGRRYNPVDFDVWDLFQHFDKATQDAIFEHVDQPGWCYALKPFPAAQAAIEEIRQLPNVEVYALTSPHHSQTWYYERVEWLKKHFKMTKHDVIQTPAKFLVRGDAFLDDNPSHVEKWKAEHPDKLAMLWHIENTRLLGMEDIRVRTWEEVLNRIRGIVRG